MKTFGSPNWFHRHDQPEWSSWRHFPKRYAGRRPDLHPETELRSGLMREPALYQAPALSGKARGFGKPSRGFVPPLTAMFDETSSLRPGC